MEIIRQTVERPAVDEMKPAVKKGRCSESSHLLVFSIDKRQVSR